MIREKASAPLDRKAYAQMVHTKLLAAGLLSDKPAAARPACFLPEELEQMGRDTKASQPGIPKYPPWLDNLVEAALPGLVRSMVEEELQRLVPELIENVYATALGRLIEEMPAVATVAVEQELAAARK
jgi:hypothetical protein